MTQNTDFQLFCDLAERSNDSAFLTQYAGESHPWITERVAQGSQLHFVRVFTGAFAQAAGCSSARARKRLRSLRDAGLLVERSTPGGCTAWKFTDREVTAAVGAVIIRRLAEVSGLPFLDTRKRV